MNKMEYAVIAQNVGKQFHRYRADRPRTFQEAVLRGLHRLQPENRLWALRNASFQIKPGRMVGLIGANGAGKSTLLRLVGGVYRADEGSVQVSGRVGALLDLGTGFHSDLTGRENIMINGVISGLSRKEVNQRFESIVEFAELAEFIESPLRTYSTGMQLRLAFAIATHIQPEVLLIDEVLAVGDIAFQQKCLKRIEDFKSQGCTILLVSHDPDAIRRMCDEVIWLRTGEVAAQGPTELITDQYVAEMKAEEVRRTPKDRPVRVTSHGVELRPGQNRLGSFDVEITNVNLVDLNGTPVQEINSGDPLRVEIEYLSLKPVVAPIFVVTLTKEDGAICFDTDTETSGSSLQTIAGKGAISLQFDRLDLAGGVYYVEVGAFPSDWSFAYDYHWHVYSFIVQSSDRGKGILSPPRHWA